MSDGDVAHHPDISPRHYTDITTHLPEDPEELHQVASRPGANTRLKSMAHKSVTRGHDDEGEPPEDHDGEESSSDTSSSPSLEMHSSMPPYHELA